MIFARRVAGLERRLEALPGLLVALSGGVDSAVLLAAARGRVRGPLLAATARSAAVPAEEIEAASGVAAFLGVRHVVVDTRELEQERYRANAGDRCYFCRREMYDRLRGVARAHGVASLADGLQAEDALEDRPGVRAARELEVLHPLREAGLGKAEIRRLARAYGLALHDKPAQPCLASRLPVGVEVTGARLERVHRAERAVRALGFLELRVRCERSHGRVEVSAAEMARALRLRGAIEAAVRSAGFETAALDPRGYRSGGAGRI